MSGVELIVFGACMLSFAAAVMALFAFLKKRQPVFLHLLCVLGAFFLISAQSLAATVHGVLTAPVPLMLVGSAVSLVFSAGVLGLALDCARVPARSRVRIVPWAYGLAASAALVCVAVWRGGGALAAAVNVAGIWIPSLCGVCIAVPSVVRGDGRGAFPLHRRVLILLGVLNLACAAVSWWSPFVFISALSLTALVLFWHYFFGNAVAASSGEVSDRFAADFSLTPREREILNALVQGKTNRELAAQFFVSEKTIETHVAHLYKKIGVKNRLELFARIKR